MNEPTPGVETPSAESGGTPPGQTTEPKKKVDQNANAFPDQWQAKYMDAVSKHEAQSFQLRRENDELKKQMEALQADVNSWKQDPVTAFEKYGGNIDSYTQRLMNDGKPTADQRIEELMGVVGELKTKLSEREKTETEKADEAKQNAYFSNHADEVKKVFSSSDDYKPVTQWLTLEKELFDVEPDLVGAVRGPFETQLAQSGKGLTPAESAAKILADSQKLIERLRASKTLKELLGVETKVPPEDQPNPVPQKRTLSNDMDTGSTPKPVSKMSNAEFYRYARNRLAAESKK